MGKVVQLEPRQESGGQAPVAQGVPPLSQSRQGTTACPTMYRHLYIEGRDVAVSEAADRGRAVHAAIASYVRHLVEKKRATDFEMLNGLMASASEEVASILERFRDVTLFEPEKVLDAELWIGLDANFFPVQDRALAHYEGTLDLVQLQNATEAVIDDWKSYWQIVDADTFQSKLYPFLLMCINPALEKVTFRLRFVRYGDAARSATYTREDMPKLRKLVEAERARQCELHNRALTPQEFEARPGRHCMWCPLLNNNCPIATVNPYKTQTPQQRVALEIYYQEARKQNLKILKDVMVEHGPVSYRDEVGTEYVARFEAAERKSYPLGQAMPVLTTWVKDHPGDGAMVEGLTIGGLSSPVKTKKREGLRKQLAEVADVRVSTKLKVGRPGEPDETEDE